jgi:hypothetical protein
MVKLTSAQVWQEIERNLFAVLGMVTAHGEARTVGIVYVVRDRKLYIGTGASTWKARHVAQNPHVSLTIPLAKRIPLMPWFKIPAATITFSGTAMVQPAGAVDPEIIRTIFRGMTDIEDVLANLCVIVVEPAGDFITYGIGIPLIKMRSPELARGRAPVNPS